MKTKFLKVLSKFGNFLKEYDITIYENEVELTMSGYTIISIIISEGKAITTFKQGVEFDQKELNIITLIMNELENEGE